MILGHSETPPLRPHFGRELSLQAAFTVSLFYPRMHYLHPSICRALAERGDWLRDMALREELADQIARAYKKARVPRWTR